MPPIVDFAKKETWPIYSEKAYINYEIFKMLFGGSPSEWAERVPREARNGLNAERITFISDKLGLAKGYVESINLADECINFQSGANLRSHLNNWGCTSIGIDGVIGQTMDLFTVELCLVREDDVLYLTMPPYLCLLGMGKHIAMCTNHLFDEVQFEEVPISHIRRTLLDMPSLSAAIRYLKDIKPTTSVNFLLSDGDQAVDVEVRRDGVKIIESYLYSEERLLAHTNHLVNNPFYEEKNCLRLKTAVKELFDGKNIEVILDHTDIVQPIANGFGTIASIWMNPKQRVLAFRDPGQTTYTRVKV